MAGLVRGGHTSNAQFITDLYAGFLQRTPEPDGYNYWLGVLNGGASRASLIPGFANSIEFQDNVKALCWATGTSGGIKYVLSDLQGSTRAVMNNNGVGTSSIIARHDYLPFGEEISAGTGLRTAGQGYGALDTNRWKYNLLERDNATGLDHASWRKYESTAGRWTSPDPLAGTIANPQSFNRYAYTQNDPVNFVDSSGLNKEVPTDPSMDLIRSNPMGFMSWAGSVSLALEAMHNIAFSVPVTTWDPVTGYALGNFLYVPAAGSVTFFIFDGLTGGRGGPTDVGGAGGGGGEPRNPEPRQDPEVLRRQVKKDCLAREKEKAEQARNVFIANQGKRVLSSGAFGAFRGAIAGAIYGGTTGATLAGVGAIPGAIGGGIIGAIAGFGGGVIGSLFTEPVWRKLYNHYVYQPSLDKAELNCDAEANVAVFNASR